MKKLILFLALTVVTFSETVSVNMDYLVNKHPKIEAVKKEIETEKTRLENTIKQKADELSVEKSSLEAKKDKVTDEEIAAFYKKEQELQKLYSESQSSLLSFKDKKFQALYNEVVEAVKTLQKLKKYDAIVEKTAIYIGSEKIKVVSDDVLNTLKSSEKIDLK